MGHADVSPSFNLYSEALPYLGCKFEEIAFPPMIEVAGAAAGFPGDRVLLCLDRRKRQASAECGIRVRNATGFR